MITQSRLKELLHYNPDTGVFTWLVDRGRGIKAGAVAGTMGRYYRYICVDNKHYTAHRLAFLYMEGEFPLKQTDHINRIKTDNRFSNLRKAASAENLKNKSRHKNNTSGVTGVHWNAGQGKWNARIRVLYQCIHLGSYKDKADAIAARKAAEIEHGFYV